jgi:pheromone alpha factor receptor
MTYTSVEVVLPLGTLAAQRIANPSAFSSAGGSKASNNRNDPPALKSWHSTTDGGSQGGVSAHVESQGGHPRRNSMQEAGSGFAKYDGADMEKGVRIQRQIQHHEEMA